MKFLVYNTQGTNIIAGVLFALMLGSKVRANVSVKSFYKIGALDKGVNGTMTTASSDIESFHYIEALDKGVNGTMTTASSDIECARMCSRNDTCASFTYDMATSACKMSDKVITCAGKETYVKRNENTETGAEPKTTEVVTTSTSGKTSPETAVESTAHEVVTTPTSVQGTPETSVDTITTEVTTTLPCAQNAVVGCENNNGFKSDYGVCYGCVQTLATYDEAQTTCCNLGGHLLTIPDEMVFNQVKGECGTNAYPWIDGKGGLTHNGLPLPWEDWFSGTPGPTECSAISQNDMKMIKYSCSSQQFFVCQIDI